MRVVIIPCIDCGRLTVQYEAYKRFATLREQRYVRRASYGMCAGCCGLARNRGTLPHPAPRKYGRQVERLDSATLTRLRAMVGGVDLGNLS